MINHYNYNNNNYYYYYNNNNNNNYYYYYYYYYYYFASLSIKEGGLKTFRRKSEILELPGNGEMRANYTL